MLIKNDFRPKNDCLFIIINQMLPDDYNSELIALISLLDEPDSRIYGKVRDKISSYGTEAIHSLEAAWDHSFDSLIQKRIEDIIHEIQFNNLLFEFNKWRHYHFNDLLKGFMLVAKYQYPDLIEKTITDKMGQIIQDVWLELNKNLTPLENVKVINHILFDVHEFAANKANLNSPQNSYINTIFETKKANPISLSIIYMVVAQSLKIPIYGINLPQNFIMAYTDNMIEESTQLTRNNIRFYINAFNRGAVFTKREVELFIKQIDLKEEDAYFLPCDNVAIIRRVLNNLIFAYENLGISEKVSEFRKILSSLD